MSAHDSSDEDSDAPMDLSVKGRGGQLARRVSSDGDEHLHEHGLPPGQSILYNELANPYTLFSYYYLMNQAGPLASRASVAAAMADAYTKLTERMVVSSQDHHHHRFVAEHHHPAAKYHHTYHQDRRSPHYPLHEHHHQQLRLTKNFDTSSSPSSSLDDGCNMVAGKAELRSADTTALLDTSGGLGAGPNERKRISRPLTGRHVRHGTGASPSTLLVLRKLLKERQRLRELGLPLPAAKKGRKATKRK